MFDQDRLRFAESSIAERELLSARVDHPEPDESEVDEVDRLGEVHGGDKRSYD
jgi:hypothetical protein